MSQPQSTDEEIQTNYFAALDLGSNSFHFVLARKIDEQVQILHSEKYRVKLAQGLSKDDWLSDEAIARGIHVLNNITQSANHLTQDNFRIVATYTLRQAKNAQAFLKAAADIFPFDIEIISGHEEARLIYQGVAQYTSSQHQQLVVDIGGGSTECIIGKQQDILSLESLNMGCVSFNQRFFDDGKITEKAFKSAIRAAKHEVDLISKRFKKTGWKTTLGTSGTIKNIYQIINYKQELAQPISLTQVKKLQTELIEFGHVDNISMEGLKENRRQVICSGLAIVIALMEGLSIEALDYCQYALREGVLHEQVDNYSTADQGSENVRQRSVNSLASRFNVDQQQVSSIQQQLSAWFNQIKQSWQLNGKIYLELLMSAVKLHELGVDINPSNYHKHGNYILSNTDLAGFNQEQQQALAWLVGNQRKKISPLSDQHWYLLKTDKLNKLVALLRLAILLNQQRQTDIFFPSELEVSDNSLHLTLDQQWLLDRPIVDTELYYEQELLSAMGIKLILNTSDDDIERLQRQD